MRFSKNDPLSTKCRMTHQCQAIIDELKKGNTHLTADEVYERVRRQLPRISPGTVYRNLRVLVQHGLIKKIEFAGQQKMYDGKIKRHYHLLCIKCNLLQDVLTDRISIDFHALEKEGFKITGYRFELLGVCAKCKSG